jgi:RHS repeat-associated protein
VRTLLADGTGNVTHVAVDGTPEPSPRRYEAFGALRSGTSIVQRGFAGQPFEGASGLVYLRARHYDPATGRFLQTDPLGIEADHLYAYARNNPLAFADPTGLDAWSLQGQRMTDAWADAYLDAIEDRAYGRDTGYASRSLEGLPMYAGGGETWYDGGVVAPTAPQRTDAPDPIGPNPGNYFTAGVGVDVVLFGGFEATGGFFLGRSRGGELQAGFYFDRGPAVGFAFSVDAQAKFIANVDQLDQGSSINFNAGFLAANGFFSANPTAPNDADAFIGDFVNSGGAGASLGPFMVEGFISFTRTSAWDIIGPVRRFFDF